MMFEKVSYCDIGVTRYDDGDDYGDENDIKADIEDDDNDEEEEDDEVEFKGDDEFENVGFPFS